MYGVRMASAEEVAAAAPPGADGQCVMAAAPALDANDDVAAGIVGRAPPLGPPHTDPMPSRPADILAGADGASNRSRAHKSI